MSLPPRASPAERPAGRISRYRIELPRAGLIPVRPGRFEATEFAENRSGLRGTYLHARDAILGKALANYRLEGERLSKIKALAVFSSDALSSVAYATQEILFVLVLAGPSAMQYSLPIAGMITLLLAIVITSYRQTVRAYPGGGGAYIVAHENLGVTAGLVAAAALLIDYVLTVSVSVAAGMDALVSLNTGLRPFAVPMGVSVIALVALVNLRGLKESGTIFAIPTYAFVVTLGAAISLVLLKIVMDGENPLAAGTADPAQLEETGKTFGLILLLKAFANGCAALTGVEAISNGVQAFKKPESRNAGRTLLAMGLILGVLFLGMTVVARHYAYIPHEDNTIPAQLAATAFGDGTVLFGFLQLMTAGILVLAANTAFADFPRLSAILARDGYLPRVFYTRGNRLVFTYGIVALASLACLLLVAFDAKTTRLIPLYALGVFLSFTLSQSGMVRHWLKTRDVGWRQSSVVNCLGAIATGVVLCVILQAKFFGGAWMIVVLIPVLAGLSALVARFYRGLRRSLHVPPEAVLDVSPVGRSSVPVLVPVEEINLAAVLAIGAACERSSSVRAVHVVVDADTPSDVEARWAHQFPGVPLVVIDSPYRNAIDPVAIYVQEVLRSRPHEVIVVVPVVEVSYWYQKPLVNQGMKRLKSMLAYQRHAEVLFYPVAAGSRGRRRTKSAAPRD